MQIAPSLVLACLVAALAGCASTKVETSGEVTTAPFCQLDGDKIAVLALWSPKWRPDQKEPALREAAALHGLEDFLATTRCVSSSEVRRFNAPEANDRPSDEQLMNIALASKPTPDRVVFVTVRELGPKLLIGIPAIVEGGTEVVLEIRVIDSRTARPLADLKTHWQNGGKFVIKGVKSLPQDMKSALYAALMSKGAPQ
jgi:hypothetical protein